MRKHLILLGAYFNQFLKTRLAYKWDFFISVFTSFTATILSLMFVWVIFGKIPRLKDWSFDEVLFLYGFSLVPFGLFNVVSLNLYQFSENYLVEGRFDRVLLRPLDSLYQVLFESFRLESLQEVVTGLVVMYYAASHLGHAWIWADLFWFPVTLICAAIIYLSIFILFTSVSFWFEDRIGIVPPVYNMIAFSRYPITIYNPVIQFVLSWLIPFAFASFYPASHFLRREEFTAFFYLVPLVALVFFTMACTVWRMGVRHYNSTGS
jgi:ABC-2 type transport system permease protein